MNKNQTTQLSFVNVFILLGMLVFFAGIVAALLAASNSQSFAHNGSARVRRSDAVPVAPAGEVYEAWGARYNRTGKNYYEAIDVGVDNSGNVYVAGTSRGSGTLNDYATIKYDSAGQRQWV